MDTKICIKCGAELNLSLFGKRKDSKDGYGNECKECLKERAKQYRQGNKDCIVEHKKQYYQDNKEHIAEHSKQYRQDTKEHIAEHRKQYYQDNKDWLAEQAKQYYQDNKEYIKQYRQDNKDWLAEHKKQYCQDNKEHITKYRYHYSQDNKEHIAEHSKQYRHEHLEEDRIKSQKRRALKSGLLHTLTNKQWVTIRENWNLKCAYCGKELPLVQEHFIPLTKGGEYTHKNIICACQSCNSSKGAKDFFIWYPKYKYFSEERELKIIEYIEGVVG